MKLTTFRYTKDAGWSTPSLDAIAATHDAPTTVVFAFAASCFIDDAAPLEQLARAFGKSHIVGCSTAGEIHDTRVADGSIVVAVAHFEPTGVSYGAAPVPTPEDSFSAGVALARQMMAVDLRGVLMFSDGLGVNGSELVRGANSVLPETVIVTGGLAGDGDRFRQTWVLDRGKPRKNVVVAVGLHGEQVRIGHGSKGGWDIFGPERVVTRSKGNVLFELDGKPALELYKRYLGERAHGLPATALLFPLALRSRGDDAKSLVRTVLGVDEQEQ